jgi:hypothetical protein
MYQLATAPRGIGQVLDAVFRLTRLAFTRMLPFAVLAGLLSAVPFVYFITSGALDNPATLAAFELSPAYWITTLLMVPLNFLVYGAGITRIESIAQGADVGFGAAVSRTLPRILPIVVASILYVLAVCVGLVLLLVPGLILAVSLYMFLPAILLDGKGPAESIGYSHKLVWGNWWRVATISTVALIIMYLLFLIAGLLLGVFAGFGNADLATMFLIQMGATVVASLLVMPYFMALYVEVFRELKMRKLGGDLAARIETVGAAR